MPAPANPIEKFLTDNERGFGVSEKALELFKSNSTQTKNQIGVVVNQAAAGAVHQIKLEGIIIDSLTAKFISGDDDEMPVISPASVKTALKSVSSGDICVSINSPGGSVFDAADIMGQFADVLDQGRQVEMRVVGVAASAAASIAMSGSSMTINRMAMLMIHRSSVNFVGGHAEDLRRYATTLEKIDSTLIDLIVYKTKLTQAEVKQLVDAETWFTAKEAVDKGFADQIKEPPKQAELDKTQQQQISRPGRVVSELVMQSLI